MLARDMGLEIGVAKSQATPGVKQKYDEEKHAGTEDSLEDIINHIRAIRPRCMKVTFDDSNLVSDIGTSNLSPIPRDHLLTGELFSKYSIPIPRGCDRYTGLSMHELQSLRDKHLQR